MKLEFLSKSGPTLGASSLVYEELVLGGPLQ
jgi:hypothetical protein